MTATANSIQMLPTAAPQPAVSAGARSQTMSSDAGDTTFAGVLGGSMQGSDSAASTAGRSPDAAGGGAPPAMRVETSGSAAPRVESQGAAALRVDGQGDAAPCVDAQPGAAPRLDAPSDAMTRNAGAAGKATAEHGPLKADVKSASSDAMRVPAKPLTNDASGAEISVDTSVVSATETVVALNDTAPVLLPANTAVPTKAAAAESQRAASVAVDDAGDDAAAKTDSAVNQTAAWLLPAKQSEAAQCYGEQSELRHVVAEARGHSRSEKRNAVGDTADATAGALLSQAATMQATTGQAAAGQVSLPVSVATVSLPVNADTLPASASRAAQAWSLDKTASSTSVGTTPNAVSSTWDRAATATTVPVQDFSSSLLSTAAALRESGVVKAEAGQPVGANELAATQASANEVAVAHALDAAPDAAALEDGAAEVSGVDGTAATSADAAAAQNRLSAMAVTQQRGTGGTIAVAARPAAAASATNAAGSASATGSAAAAVSAETPAVRAARPVRSGAASSARAEGKDAARDTSKSGDVADGVAGAVGTAGGAAVPQPVHAVAATAGNAGHSIATGAGSAPGNAMGAGTVQAAVQHAASQAGLGDDVTARGTEGPTAGGRIEVGFSDATLGPLQIHATVGSTGEVHVGIAGQAAHTEAVLEQITPLLHAAVVQEAAVQGSTSTFHVSAMSAGAQADSGLSQRQGGGDTFTSHAGGNTGMTSGGEQGRGGDGSRGQSSSSRTYATDALSGVRSGGADRVRAFQATVPLQGQGVRGSGGLSVRI